MCYIELKNEKYETLEDLKRLLHYILRLDKTAEDSQRANTITNTLATPHCFLRSNRLYFATGCSISSRKNSKYLCEERLYYSLWNSCG